MILSELISPCLVKNDWTQIKNTPIRHITQYIEEVTTDSLFVCINNTKYDGHDFISEALAQGARAIIVDHLPQNGVLGPFIVVSDTNKALAHVAAKFYDYPSRDMVFLGVTGTNGKTTTTFLIHEILRQSDLACGLIGTMYNQIGDQRIATPNTTPHTVQLQKLIAQMAQETSRVPLILTCEYDWRNPRGIGETVPRFSWKRTETSIGSRQTKYRITVGTDMRLRASSSAVRITSMGPVVATA